MGQRHSTPVSAADDESDGRCLEGRVMVGRGNGKSTMTTEVLLDVITGLEEQQPPEEYWLTVGGRTFFGRTKDECYQKAIKHYWRKEEG